MADEQSLLIGVAEICWLLKGNVDCIMKGLPTFAMPWSLEHDSLVARVIDEDAVLEWP